MSDKDNKFIIGDNADGYRRSGNNDVTQKFNVPEKQTQQREVPQQREIPHQPKQREAQPQQRRPMQQKREPSAKPQQQHRPAPHTQQRRPVGDTRQMHRNPRQTKPGATGGVRRPAPRGQAQMSPNERRHQYNAVKRRKLKIKQITNYAVIGAIILCIVIVLSLTLFFRISEITVTGQSPYSAEQIIASSGLSIGENVIRCDASGASQKLSSVLPYIGSATVKRSLSGKVVITVKTTEGMYSFIDGDKCAVIDSTGKVLEYTTVDKCVDYTMIIGATAKECVPGKQVQFDGWATFETIKGIKTELDNASITSITSINISDQSYVLVVYNGRLTIIIGSMDNITHKLALAARVIGRENEIDPMQYGKIDLTVDGKAYFSPDESTEANSEESAESADTAG